MVAALLQAAEFPRPELGIGDHALADDSRLREARAISSAPCRRPPGSTPTRRPTWPRPSPAGPAPWWPTLRQPCDPGPRGACRAQRRSQRRPGPTAWPGFPDKLRLALSGITGTNGKTTTSFLLRGLLEDGWDSVLIGTVAYWVGPKKLEAPNTTPSALELQSLFAQGVKAGCKAAVMEVSSHALDQGRTAGLAFDTAAFSNLTRDHLDYHKTMAAYGAAKARLFGLLAPDGTAVVNAQDDPGAGAWPWPAPADPACCATTPPGGGPS